MEYLRNSANFIWSTSFASGIGATASVYQGVHEKTGEPVAVKVFNHKSHLRPWSERMREYEIMKGLSHDNIVRMIAVEEEVQSRKQVIVMELCNGGSLHAILNDPQNSCGLEEEEFLCVLKDISAGIKYLRDNSIIHRDLKPGNIMKFISEDGRSIYKLADFGAARFLDDDQQFISLHGTEEYLHPDMYERAFIHPRVTSFGATVDLWSIGVTLYHVATGLLPFQPFGGKIHRQTMHKITSEKESGVISGVQHSKNGPVEYSRELPKTCLLSQGLKDLILVLLAGLLECKEKIWTFNQFFQYVTDIISRKVFHIFYLNEGKEIRLYMQPNKMLQDLKEQIFAQTKVPSSNQLLFFDKSLFVSQINPLLDVSTFPSTTIDQPLILVHMENKAINHLTRLGPLSICFPNFPSSVSTISDTNLAKTCVSIGYSVKRSVSELVRFQEFLFRIPKILVFLSEDSIVKLCSNLDVLQKEIEDVNHRTDILQRSCSLVQGFVSALPNDPDYKNELQRLSVLVTEQKKYINQVKEKFTQLQSSINSLDKIIHMTMIKWKEAFSGCSSLTGCVERADTYIKRMCDSWQVFLNERNRELSVQYLRLHALERVKIMEASKKLLNLSEECLNSCLQASTKFAEWYSGIQPVMVKSHVLDEDLVSISDNLKSNSTSLKKAESEVCGMSERIGALFKTETSRVQGIQLLKQVNKDFTKIAEKQETLLKRLSLLTCDMDSNNNKKHGYKKN